ncbi:unnamed protein product [Sphagnum balticum]
MSHLRRRSKESTVVNFFKKKMLSSNWKRLFTMCPRRKTSWTRRFYEITLLLEISKVLNGLKDREGGIHTPADNPKAFGVIKRYFKKDIDEILTMSLSTAQYAAGAIHIVRCATDQKLNEEDINLFSSISSQVAIALESIRFFESSITDEMTQIYNKRYFISRLENEVDKAERHSEPMSLLFFDVDHFKKLNDNYGHQAGDLILKTLAQNVRLNCRKYDIPARYGGEEFVVVLPKTPAAGAFIIAERLRKGVEGMRVLYDGQELKTTISIGIATFPKHAENSDALISYADKALYVAKSQGRNRTTTYEQKKKSG